MLKTIVCKSTKKEYTIQVNNGSGENLMLCPVCSVSRTKKTDKCLGYNSGIGAGRCNHCQEIFYEKKSTCSYKRKKFKPLQRVSSKNDYLKEYFNNREISLSVALDMDVTTVEHSFRVKGIKAEKFANKQCVCYNYYVGDEIFYQKFKTKEKDFSSIGSGAFVYNHNVFVQSALFSKKKRIIICEGEDDCLSIKDAGFDYVISPPNGAESFEFLDKYDPYFEVMKEIYIAVDQDEAGFALEQEILRRYNSGNCYKVNLRLCKDANDYIKKYGKEKLKEEIENSDLVPTEGAVPFSAVKEKAWHIARFGYEKGISTGFPLLDSYFTWRPKDVTVFAGYSGHGKTTLLANLTVAKSIVNNFKWAVFTPEYGVAEDFYIDMSEIYLGKTIVETQFSKRKATDAQIERAFNFIDDHFLFVYPKRESHTLENIMKEVVVNVKTKGINGVIIDPFNQLQRSASQTSRDIFVQQFLRTAKIFANKYNLIFAIVVHPKTANDTNPKEPNQYSISEGDSWNQSADNLIIVHRPYYQEQCDSTVTSINICKIKRQKQVGKRGKLLMEYNPKTYRYYQPSDRFDPFPAVEKEDYKEGVLLDVPVDVYKPD